MKLDIFNVDELVEVNKIKEVTSPIYFSFKGVPNDEGLFSYTIFGRPGSLNREITLGYIDLGGNYLHPLVYLNLKRLNRKIEKLIAGTTYFILKNNQLTEVEEEIEDSFTGLKGLYDNWENILFKKTSSIVRKERLGFLKNLKKNEAFMTKQLVLPPLYRDINLQKAEKGIISHDIINDLYAKLLRLVSSNKANSDFGNLGFVNNITSYNIQTCINDIYEYCTSKVAGKYGLFRQTLLGKNVDYAGRSVISAPNINQETYKDMPVNIDRSGIPIMQCINIFHPFIQKWVLDFFTNTLRDKNFLTDINGKLVKLHNNYMDDFSILNIDKMIKLYSKSPSERFNPVKIRTENGTRIPIKISKNNINEDSFSREFFERYLTWTDVFYMAAVDVCKDKHVYITRYPLTNLFGIYPSKISVLSTNRTKPMIFNGIEYKNYPIIDIKTPMDKIPPLFADTLKICNMMCHALGADYDGDTIIVRGCFTQESNKEANDLMNSPRSIFDIDNSNIRKIDKEAIQCLYNLTK